MVNVTTLDGDYVIDRFNGRAVSEKYTASLTTVDSTSVRVHFTVGNIMNGTVKLSENVLTGMLMTTLMLGTEEQQAIETAIAAGFEKGMHVVQKGRVLLMHSGRSSFRLTKA